MTGAILLAASSVPPLAILAIATLGWRSGGRSAVLALIVGAGVLPLPLPTPALRSVGEAPGLRFAQPPSGAAYASLLRTR